MGVYLCGLSNIKSGVCQEDCKFCTQSVHWKANIPRFRWKGIIQLEREVRELLKWGVEGFCLVTSGKGIEKEKEVEQIAHLFYHLHKRFPTLKLIGCFGIVTEEALREWKSAGMVAYNHNLESSFQFYPNLCTTHRWEERLETCYRVKKVGLELYSGGIFGVGEGEEDWYSLFKTLQSLNPETVPLNFFIPNRALPITPTHSFQTALQIISIARNHFPNSKIMLAGGRELLFGEKWWLGIEQGANGIILGNYLTTPGANPAKDWKILLTKGYRKKPPLALTDAGLDAELDAGLDTKPILASEPIKTKSVSSPNKEFNRF